MHADMKSSYNERFSFDDPMSKWSACRSTRARATKKSKKATDADELSTDLAADAAAKDPGLQEVEGTLNSPANTDSHTDFQELVQNCTDRESDLLAENKCAHSVCNVNNDDDEHDESFINVTNYPQSMEYEVVSPEETPLYMLAEEDEEDVQNLENSNQEAQLYSGAPITTMCSRIILMKFTMKHRITQEALADLLQILQLHLPSPNNVPSTLYHFRKEFKALQYPLIYHHFCNECLMPTSMETEVCENILCKNSFSERHSKSNFIEIPIHLQLQCILECKYLPVVSYIST